MENPIFESVWDALEDTPEAAENLKARAALLLALQDYVNGLNVPAVEAARQIGLTLPRLRDLLQGRIDVFSLDALVALLGRAGKRVEFQIRDAA